MAVYLRTVKCFLSGESPLGEKSDMNQNPKTEQLLNKLREAIHESLADSLTVLAAMSELEDAGLTPAFSVDITLPERNAAPSLQLVNCDEGLILTAADASFLRTLGITTPAD